MTTATLDSIQQVGHELLGIRPPLPPRMETAVRPQTTVDLNIQTRHDIAWRVAQGLKLSSVASEFLIDVELVEAVVDEIFQAMSLQRIIKPQTATNTRKRCMAISSLYLWIRAADQNKYEPLIKIIDREFERKDMKSIVSMWQDWSICLDGDFISLMNPRPALRLVSRLLALGVTKKALIVSSSKEAAPLAREIDQLGLTPTECTERGGRADHRLFLAPRGVDAAKASGATISVVGLHWWMLVVGSKLIAMEEI